MYLTQSPPPFSQYTTVQGYSTSEVISVPFELVPFSLFVDSDQNHTLSGTETAGKDAGRGAVAFVYMRGGCQEAKVTRRVWTSNKQRAGVEGVAVWRRTLLQRKDRADWNPSAKLFNPHLQSRPDQQNSPGTWQLDPPDAFAFS